MSMSDSDAPDGVQEDQAEDDKPTEPNNPMAELFDSLGNQPKVERKERSPEEMPTNRDRLVSRILRVFAILVLVPAILGIIRFCDGEDEAQKLADQCDLDNGMTTGCSIDQLSSWAVKNMTAKFQNGDPAAMVLSIHWTEAEAECVFRSMIRERTVNGLKTLMLADSIGADWEDGVVARPGSTGWVDAELFVQSVADCVDLKALVLADMVGDGVEDPDCLLADVTEEQSASWFVALLTDGRDGFGKLLRADLNQAC